jgi:methionine-rich copper-binding protein CopC
MRTVPGSVRGLHRSPLTATPGRRDRTLAGAALALLFLPLALVAQAHSELRSSVPAAGARLGVSPPRIELRFNEPVQLTALRLVDAHQATIRLHRETGMEARADATAVLPPLAPGGYRIVWAAISADGHPIRGTIRFEVLAAPAAPGRDAKPAAK